MFAGKPKLIFFLVVLSAHTAWCKKAAFLEPHPAEDAARHRDLARLVETNDAATISSGEAASVKVYRTSPELSKTSTESSPALSTTGDQPTTTTEAAGSDASTTAFSEETILSLAPSSSILDPVTTSATGASAIGASAGSFNSRAHTSSSSTTTKAVSAARALEGKQSLPVIISGAAAGGAVVLWGVYHGVERLRASAEKAQAAEDDLGHESPPGSEVRYWQHRVPLPPSRVFIRHAETIEYALTTRTGGERVETAVAALQAAASSPSCLYDSSSTEYSPVVQQLG